MTLLDRKLLDECRRVAGYDIETAVEHHLLECSADDGASLDPEKTRQVLRRQIEGHMMFCQILMDLNLAYRERRYSGDRDALIAAIAELVRQAEEHRPDTPHIYDRDEPHALGIDGKVDLWPVLEKAIEANDATRERMIRARMECLHQERVAPPMSQRQ
jgi:hypothetical protein